MGGRIHPGHAVCLRVSLPHPYNIPLPFFSFFFPNFSPNSWPWGACARRQPALPHCEGQEIPSLPGGSHPHGWHPDELIKKKQGRRGASPWGQLLGDAISWRDARGSQGAASQGGWEMLVLRTVPGEPQPQDAVLGVLGLCPPNFPQILARPAKIQLLHLAPAKVVMMQNGNGKEEEAGHLHCQQQLISWRRLVSPGSVFFCFSFFFCPPSLRLARAGTGTGSSRSAGC